MLQVVERIVDEVRGAWRYRWIALTVAWGVTVIGWLFVFAIPDMYEARARVYVDTRTPLRPLLEGVAADPDFESQILIVRQALLGAPNLVRVAREAGLLESTGASEQRRAMISEM